MPIDPDDDNVRRIDSDPYNHEHSRTVRRALSQGETPDFNGEQRARRAAALSALVTGLGQCYNGEYGKGAALFFLQIINVLLMAVGIGFLTFAVTWFVAVVDAHEVASNA